MDPEARKKAIKQTREALTGEIDRDRLLVKAVNFLDTLEKQQEDMQRFRDWYSLHFPELEENITDDEEFLQVLSESIERRNLEAFSELAEDSTGGELRDRDCEVLEETAELMGRKQELQELLENYIEETAKDVMPNLSVLLDPLLATKLMALSGSLEDLAKSPASTIQMLGAEKALFRYMKGEGTPPKHGILFEHDFVSPLPDDTRGKMARFMANKAAMAARLDFYGEKEKGEELREEAQQKFEELRDESS